jgi:uncharacterized protein
MTSFEIAIIVLCLVAGGVMKGATGAGAPILAVPAISAIVDVRFAIVVMVATGIVTNIWQAWAYRDRLRTLPFLKPFLLAAGGGMVLGTLGLAFLPVEVLTLTLCAALVAYIGLRLARPSWQLSMEAGGRLALPAGLAAGVLQGASGLSGPAALTYLSALRLGREGFAGTISLLFLVLGIIQLPSLLALGIVDAPGLAISFAAVLPVALGMVVGNRFGRNISPEVFNNVVLVLLGLLTVKLVYDSVMLFMS